MTAVKVGNTAEEVLRLARRVRRCLHRNNHFTRLDRLRVLLLANEGASLRDLACLLDIRPPSASEWLNQLTANEEIVKTPAAGDKRVLHITFTEKGRRLALVAQEKVKHTADMFAGCLSSEEEERFTETCRRLYQHLEGQAYHRPSQSRAEGRREEVR